ncbi:MAG TPA: hypothetical protein VIY48_13560 [Candidatus Paceibacterota bacterium]
MPLVLAPSFDEHTRAEIEAHLDAVRARRMVAAIEYHQGAANKLQHESDKINAKIARQYEMLRKELLAMEKAELKVQDRLELMDHMLNEVGLVNDMIRANPVVKDSEMEE